MPYAKKICPTCQNQMDGRSQQCRKCKPSYVRTIEHRKLMSCRTKGKKKHYPSASTRPEVAAKIRQAWTPAMKEAARQRGIDNSQNPAWRLKCGSPGQKNPMWENGRSQIPYSPGWARKVKRLAWKRANYCCEICGSGKPRDTHHKDFRKDNHDLENLQVLCRKCHKGLHASRVARKRKIRRRLALRQNKNLQG